MRLAVLVLVLLLVFVTLNYILKCLEYKDLRDLFDNRGKSIQMLAEVERLRHKVYVLRKDIKRKDRAIVRYKAQNEVFRHSYHETERRNESLQNDLLTECNVSLWYKNWYTVMEKERSAYLYCLRQIQEEVEHAKKE